MTGEHCYSIEAAINLFRKRLERVPIGEHETVKAYFEVQLRKARGGLRRTRLAAWSGSQPLSQFFQRARSAWNSLPKEHDGHGRRLPKKRLMIGNEIAS